MVRRRKSSYVALSELARVGSCELRIVLEAQHGPKRSTVERQLAAAGEQEHARMHQAATNHHNRARRKGPCFIATAVFGPDHPDTWRLRAFRDARLRTTWMGRRCIALYYRLSPSAASWLRHHPRHTRWIAPALSWLARTLEPKKT